MLILILIGCYYLINALIFVGIHAKKTSNIASKSSYTSIHNNTLNPVLNTRNNEINEPLLSPVSETQYDVGFQLN